MRHRCVLWTISSVKTKKLWDIFCHVIDNYGDIGVCWRLSAGLAARGERVRLWVDDASALDWMAPTGAPGVELRPWTQPLPTAGMTLGDVLVEAFGCEIAPEFIAACVNETRNRRQELLWINLEYLSAEGFVERNHGLPSPVLTGPGAGLNKYFFYPGFNAATGGLLREPDLAARQAQFDRATWLDQLGVDFHGERLISMFCYEPPALCELLEQLAVDQQPTRLLVTAGRSAAAVKICLERKNRSRPLWNQSRTLTFSWLPRLTQNDFDHLLWSCDLNFVRGEDSLVRALWAGKPFIWQIYPQDDAVHLRKLDAFLDAMQAPLTLRVFHHRWNRANGAIDSQPALLPALTPAQWQDSVDAMRTRLLRIDDLVTQLIKFVSKNH